MVAGIVVRRLLQYSGGTTVSSQLIAFWAYTSFQHINGFRLTL